MSLDSLKTLYLHELRDLYSAEGQLVRALPRLQKAADSPELATALKNHLQQTKEHLRRLDQIFADMGEDPKGPRCKGMAALLKEGKDMLKEGGDAGVLDTALIAAAQKVEHYEMSGYASVRNMAAMLREDRAAEVLQQTLNEESAAEQILSELSEATMSVAGTASQRLTDIGMQADRMPGGADMQGYTETLASERPGPAEPMNPAGTGAHWEEEDQREVTRNSLTGD